MLIITGERGIGKTTLLETTVDTTAAVHTEVRGLLSTRSPEGSIVLKDIARGEGRVLAVRRNRDDGDTETTGISNALRIGPYTFDERTFSWGREILQAHIAVEKTEKYSLRPVILDEIGPLEIHRGVGFASVLPELIAAPIRLILVIRPSLILQFLESRLPSPGTGVTIQRVRFPGDPLVREYLHRYLRNPRKEVREPRVG